MLLAKPGELVFSSDFEQDAHQWNILAGCQRSSEMARTGTNALFCQDGSSSLVSRYPVSELGLLEFWVKPQSAFASYRINILTSSSVALDAQWQQVGLIEAPAGTEAYMAHRVSIDDPGRKYLRLDIETLHGGLALDDVTLERILLDTALQKNEQKIISGILDKLQTNKNYELQSESFRTIGKNYAAQLESQRQYLEYANAIYSTITFALASSERNKMSNPMAYCLISYYSGRHQKSGFAFTASPAQFNGETFW